MVFTGMVVALAASLVACVVHRPSYPVAWPPLVASGAGRCPDLAGRYTDRGETFHSPYWISLAGLLLGIKASQVEISSTENEVRISGGLDDRSTGSKTLAKGLGDFECGDGSVTLRREAEFVNREGVVGRQSRVLRLTKAVDGSLIIGNEQAGVGMAFLIPVVGTQTLWHRFRPVSVEP